MGDSVAAANAAQDEITFVMGTPEQYVRLVQARLIHPEMCIRDRRKGGTPGALI